MNDLPRWIATRPLEMFLAAAAVILLAAALAAWVLQRIRIPLWRVLSRAGPWGVRVGPLDARRPPVPAAWQGGPLLIDLLIGFAAVLLAVAAFFELADEIGLDEGLGRMDAAVASELARSASPAALRMFSWITHLGDTAVQAAICVIVALILIARHRRLLAITWIAAVAGNGILNRLLKALFQRDRPLHEHGWVVAEGWSFPSGHASGAVVVYGMLAYLACRAAPPSWRLPIVITAAMDAMLVGYSRVVLHVHYASDVLAGLLSGSAWLIVCIGAAHVVRAHHAYRASARS